VIGVVDYGLGNVQAFLNVYRALGIPAARVRTVEELMSSDRLILPGVGAFDWAMQRLNDSGLREALDVAVLRDRRPVLGVCVGMQMMGLGSDEGMLPGLGWLKATSRRMQFDNGSLPLPHMGWNDVDATLDDPLFDGLSSARFYFLHSFCVQPAEPADEIATATYGRRFSAAVRKDGIRGIQCHPEKSHEWGVKLLRNFAVL